MAKVVKNGDVVLSRAGRDKGKHFLVVSVDQNYAYIVNGRDRKVSSLKKKNIKHLETVLSAVSIDLAEKIQSGKAVGNERIYKTVKAEKQKIQED